MKILRVRRGYTTNSSGGNEWVPPPGTKVDAQKDAPSQEKLNWSETTKQVSIQATRPGTSSAQHAVTQSPSQPAPANNKGGTNLGLMGILLGAVGLLFVITAFIKRLLGGRK